MNRRVYGLIGISTIMANWNADFTGRPKTTSKGDIFGSDKALKYPMKVSWSSMNEKVFYMKSFREYEGELYPRTLTERYALLFGDPQFTESSKKKKSKADESKDLDVVKNLFSCIDVMNFGATYAGGNASVSITGAVQIGQGFNLYEDSRIEVQDILSPFKNPNAKNDKIASDSNEDTENSAKQTTIGTKITTDEAHYCYPFSVNPNNYESYKEIIEGFTGYTDEAYVKFKRASCNCATAYATNSKFGCDNEYAIFIELSEDSEIALPLLIHYVEFEKANTENTLVITELMNFLADVDQISSVEVYYNPAIIKLKNDSSFKNYKCMHIITERELAL